MNMNTKKKSGFIVALLLALTLAASACGGNEEVITLRRYTAPVDFHTELQREYLYDTPSPASLSAEIKGMEELSRPEPVTLRWEDSKNSGNYAVEISETEDMRNPLLYFTDDPEAEVYNLKIATRYFWRVSNNVPGGAKSEIGEFTTSDAGPRNMYVDGVTNVRDLGCWVNEDGERLVQGLLYRGARLNNSYPEGYTVNVSDTADRDKDCVYEREITSAGAKVFTDVMKIKTEVDFRELHGNGFPRNDDGTENYVQNVEGVRYVPIPMPGSADIDESKEEIRELFDVLAQKENYPIYFHCNIGTDRTGMVAYILGALCGLDEDTLYRDYMFSNFGTISWASMSWNGKDRDRIQLSKLTNNSGAGAAARIGAYPGETLREKTENCLQDCGVEAETYRTVREIMLKGVS